jgi:hypothetical protein
MIMTPKMIILQTHFKVADLSAGITHFQVEVQVVVQVVDQAAVLALALDQEQVPVLVQEVEVEEPAVQMEDLDNLALNLWLGSRNTEVHTAYS